MHNSQRTTHSSQRAHAHAHTHTRAPTSKAKAPKKKNTGKKKMKSAQQQSEGKEEGGLGKRLGETKKKASTFVLSYKCCEEGCLGVNLPTRTTRQKGGRESVCVRVRVYVRVKQGLTKQARPKDFFHHLLTGYQQKTAVCLQVACVCMCGWVSFVLFFFFCFCFCFCFCCCLLFVVLCDVLFSILLLWLGLFLSCFRLSGKANWWAVWRKLGRSRRDMQK